MIPVMVFSKIRYNFQVDNIILGRLIKGGCLQSRVPFGRESTTLVAKDPQ